MKITEETKIKDIIPEGYELSEVSNLDKANNYLYIILKKKEEKSFKWYVESYVLGWNSFMRWFSYILDEKYNNVPFEVKIGLLKYICDDLNFNMIYALNIITRRESHNPAGLSSNKFKSICPENFLDSIFD